MGTDRAKTRWKQDLVAYLMNIHLLNKLYIRIYIYISLYISLGFKQGESTFFM